MADIKTVEFQPFQDQKPGTYVQSSCCPAINFPSPFKSSKTLI